MWVWITYGIRGINLHRHEESVSMNGSGRSVKNSQ
jgi:hypothetical protein